MKEVNIANVTCSYRSWFDSEFLIFIHKGEGDGLVQV